MTNSRLLAAAVGVALLGGASVFGFTTLGGNPVSPVGPAAASAEAVVYKSPWCGCCTGYSEALRAAGYQVREEEHEDMNPIKARFGVPAGMTSCHTTVIGGYVVEGHVPLAAVERLLAERPDLPGIALPGMPQGVPGMPGERPERLEVLKLGAEAGAVYSVE